MLVKLIRGAILTVALGIAVPGFATVITASNAGALPASAEDLVGQYPSVIDGTLDSADGVSMFKIFINDPLDFSAYTTAVSFGVPDTELFLFTADGFGVYANDDISASNTLSCLPSGDAGNQCPSSRSGAGPTTAGVYYLAITRSANSPLSLTGNIFSFLSSTAIVGPDMATGGGQPLTGWDNGVNVGPNYDLTHYEITLSGTVPEPTAWLLTASGVILFLFRRRVRS